ncbi:glycosyltransferase family 4 protein [Cupriavidus necator]|uniref:glycosyltransferase family 4 protein n=1 Tax=Cupriavidus necator TaxID=106590 RepID=UPI00339D6049
MQTRVLALPKYGRLGASSRLRSLQFLPWLAQAQMDVTVQPLLSDAVLAQRYRQSRYGATALACAYAGRLRALWQRDAFDLLWIEKEALPWLPAWMEAACLRGVPYVLDYDDAQFHNYDLHRLALVRRLLGRRLDRLMAGARLVVAGNDYLAQRARDAGGGWVEVVPTVIDLERYRLARPVSGSTGAPPRIVWIGSPSTVRYLQLLGPALTELARTHAFTLRVIGGEFDAVRMPGVTVECVPWSEDTEVAGIGACDVGIMPLLDSPWERGKCGYKLIQYMACGLPVVASPVGVNAQIVRNGHNGLLADSTETWQQSLARLLADAPLRAGMGRAGRAMVEQTYCVQQAGPRLGRLLREAAGVAPQAGVMQAMG